MLAFGGSGTSAQNVRSFKSGETLASILIPASSMQGVKVLMPHRAYRNTLGSRLVFWRTARYPFSDSIPDNVHSSEARTCSHVIQRPMKGFTAGLNFEEDEDHGLFFKGAEIRLIDEDCRFQQRWIMLTPVIFDCMRDCTGAHA